MKRFLSFFILIGLLLAACGPVTPVPLKSQPASSTSASQPTAIAPVRSDLEPITPENITRLEQVDRLGTGFIQDVAVSPDQSQIAVYVHRYIYIYDTKTLTQMQIIVEPFWQHRTINESKKTVTFSPDGKTLAFSEGETIYLWDITQNKRRGLFYSLIPAWEVTEIGFSPDGQHLILKTQGSSARCDGLDINFALYDLSGKLLFDKYDCGTYREASYEFTTDGKVLFAFSFLPTQTFLVDIETGSL